MSFIRPESARERLRRRAERNSNTSSPTENEIAQIEAINNTSSYCRTLFFSYLALGATLFILVSGTTHEDLLRETPVKMPLFDIGVPLLTFYVVAPLLFVLFHINLLNKLSQLRKQIEQLNGAEKESIRGRLFPFDYALLFGGFDQDRQEKAVLWTIVGSTLFVMPILLLLYVQYQFLAYHSTPITFWHQLLVVGDICALFFFHYASEQRVRSDVRPVPVLGSFLIFICSSGVLVVPDSWADGDDVQIFWNEAGAEIGLYRNLQLQGRTFWAADPPPVNVAAHEIQNSTLKQLNTTLKQLIEHGDRDQAEQPKVADSDPEELLLEARLRYGTSMSLQDRDLRYANLTEAVLIGANLANAQLQGAILHGISLRHANLVDSNLVRAQLLGADLRSANARGAYFSDSRLIGTDLTDANLNGATFRNAHAVGVYFSRSRFGGTTSLNGACLVGANFRNACGLTGAKFSGAELTDVDVSDAGCPLSLDEPVPVPDVENKRYSIPSVAISDKGPSCVGEIADLLTEINQKLSNTAFRARALRSVSSIDGKPSYHAQ